MIKNKVLVTLANENYLEQAKQVFSGAYFKAGWTGDMLLLTHEISEDKLSWFRERKILIKNCSPITVERTNGKWPAVVLDKYYIFTEEFKKWDKVIFLDADTIIRKPLTDLENVIGFGAITSHKHFSSLWLNKLHMFLEGINQSPLKELKTKYDFQTKSFNTGVLAFSTDIIKPTTFLDLVNITNKYFSISASGEEAILNIHFYKQWQELSELYNFYPDFVIPEAKLKPSEIEAYILHFIINKPWIPTSPFYQEWKNGLLLADQIGIIEAPKDFTKIFNASEYLQKVNKRRKKYFYNRYLLLLLLKIDKIIGLLGLLLKKISPKLYRSIKKTLCHQ